MLDNLISAQENYATKLDRFYWDENLSLQQIADIENVSASTIHDRMKKNDIPRKGIHDWHLVDINLNPSPTLAYNFFDIIKPCIKNMEV